MGSVGDIFGENWVRFPCIALDGTLMMHPNAPCVVKRTGAPGPCQKNATSSDETHCSVANARRAYVQRRWYADVVGCEHLHPPNAVHPHIIFLFSVPLTRAAFRLKVTSVTTSTMPLSWPESMSSCCATVSSKRSNSSGDRDMSVTTLPRTAMNKV